MTRRKRATRDIVTLDSVFTGIANAIRAKTGDSDPISPRNMGNAIRELRTVAEASLPESSLPAIFQDIADAIRACGITGTMTASQMAGKIGEIVPYQKTKVTYTQESGLPDWEGVITDTAQIPNVSRAKTIRIGDDITSIANYAFQNCSGLTSITIPDSVTSIGTNAFYSCTQLNSVYITDLAAWCGMKFTSSSNPLANGADLYLNGNLVTTVTLDNIGTVGNYAFYGCTSILQVEIPSTVTTLGTFTFGNCVNLQTATIRRNTLGNSTFRGCTSLTNVVLEEGFKTTGGIAFQGCTGLTRISFPSTISTISSMSFSGCTNLAIFDFRKSTSIPTTSANAFTNTPANKEIIVPDELYDTWKATSNWASTTNNIVNCIVKASQSSLGSL